MKRILMIVNDTNFAYNLRQEVLQGLVKAGYDVTLAGEILAFREELETIGCNLIDIKTARHGTNVIQDLKLFMRYFSVLKYGKVDLVFTNNIKPNVYAGMACRLLNIPYIPNITGLGTPVEHKGPLQKLTMLLYKIGIAGAKCVFFQNTENLHFFRKHKLLSKKSKVVLLPGSGVNLQRYPAEKYPDGEQVRFLFAARIMREKGIDLFLAAAEKFHGSNVEFHICGACDDDKYSEILHKAEEAGVVTYHGQQKYMRPFYERCSCFLYPSYYPEGMSNVLLEAAACGRPVIAADRSGCRETVEDGVSGYIVPVNDEEAVLRATERFLNLTWEQRRDMGLAARKKVETEFDRELVVRMYMDEIQNLSGVKEKSYGL